MPNGVHSDSSGLSAPKFDPRRALKIAVLLAAAFGAYFLPIDGLSRDGRLCLSIFAAAAGFWVTEAIPAFATAIAVIVLSVYLLGHPVGAGEGAGAKYLIYLNPFASPVLVLFFGGFVLEIAATKHGLSQRLARAFIKPFGTRPALVLLGVILTTALFSMFMSNTATTAMMIAIMAPVLAQMEGRDKFRKALALAVPFAANIGGMGTIIGTPPNAVAVSMLAQAGVRVSFFDWMLVAAPIAGVLLLALWATLWRSYKPRTDRFEILFPDPIKVTWDLVVVAGTFGVTVCLWVTEPLHHLPAAVSALLPALVLTATGIVDRADLKKLDWDVLILVAGGMALGAGMKATGLSDQFARIIGGVSETPAVLLGALVVSAIALSNFMSNTSAANLLIPVSISIAAISPRVAAIGVALSCSLAMSLPISTPPNAIAFATRTVTTRDMAAQGLIVSAIGVAVLAAVYLFLGAG